MAKPRRQVNQQLALLLASGLTVKKAAEKVGVSARTVHKRLLEEDFRKEVVRQRDNLVNRAAGQLAARMSKAVRTLDNNLDSEFPSVANVAAKAILDQGIKTTEVLHLMARVDELERRLKASEKTPEHGRHIAAQDAGGGQTTAPAGEPRPTPGDQLPGSAGQCLPD